MVHDGRLKQPDLTNDLGPHMERCVRVFPRTERQSGPAFWLIGSRVSHGDLIDILRLGESLTPLP